MPALNQTVRKSRSAFTLIELLVVMGILALLTTIAVTAIAPTLENAKIAATRTTINQINEVIQQRLDAIQQLDISVESRKLAVTNNITIPQAEFFLRTNLYRQALPQRIEDLRGYDGTDSTADDAPLLAIWKNAGLNAGNTTVINPSNTEVTNSAMLLAALVNGSSARVLPNGKSYPLPILDLGSINQKHVLLFDFDPGADDPSTTTITENENVKQYFADAWGQPLRFYNFPTRLIRPNGTTIDVTNARILIAGLSSDTSSNGPLATDPFDPIGTAKVPFQSTMSISGLTAVIFNEQNYHTPDTFFTPLLVSSGPDQSIGLNKPNAASPDHLGTVQTQADLFDNITNRQQ